MSGNESLTDVVKEIASTLNIDRPLAVVDVETTGIWPKRDRIVQIAFIAVTPALQVSSFNQLINPEVLIPDEATAIHGITNEAVADAPTFLQVAASLSEALSGHDFVGYNLRFDREMLQAEFRRVKFPFSFDGSALIDALHIWQRLEPRKLPDAAERFIGRRPDRAHRADADVETTARVLVGQLRGYGGGGQLPMSVHELSSIRNDQSVKGLDAGGKIQWRDGAARLNFGKHQGAPLEELVNKHKAYLQWILTADFPDDLKKIISEALAGNYPTKPLRPSGDKT